MTVWTVVDQALCGCCTEWVPIKTWAADWALCSTCLGEIRTSVRSRAAERSRAFIGRAER